MAIFFEEHTFVLACRPWQTITSVIIDRDTSSLRVERKKWMMSEGSTMPCGSFLKMPTLPGSLPSLPASTHHTGCHHHHLQHHHHGNHLKIMNNYEPTLKNPENLALAAGGWGIDRGWGGQCKKWWFFVPNSQTEVHFIKIYIIIILITIDHLHSQNHFFMPCDPLWPSLSQFVW